MPRELDWPFTSRLTVLAGPARSGKTERLLAHYRLGLRRFHPGECLWLAPTARSAADVRARLPGRELSACLSPGVMTFDNFAASVLRSAADPIYPISGVLKRQLLQRLVDEAHQLGELDYFAPIADTAGFVDLLAEFISDLKRHEVWPEQYLAACRRGRSGRKDRELALLYQRYQDGLNQGRLYDAEGRFWWARTLLRDGAAESGACPRLLVADGFTDFTHTQHEILEGLAARAEWLLISLPLDVEDGRPELFRKSGDTLAELRRRHADLQVATQPRSDQLDWPAFSHVERQLFRNPREQTQADSTARIEIGAAAGQLGEVRWIARTIKQLLFEGDPLRPGVAVRPGDVAVVFRGLQMLGPLVAEVFDEYGLPLALEAAPTLDRVPALAAFLAIVRLEVEDWPLEGLLAVIANTYFQPDWPAWRAGQAAIDVDWIARELQIPAGSELLRAAVARWAAGDDPPIASDESADIATFVARRRHLERREHARGAMPLLEQLATVLGRLPREATGNDWSLALESLASEIHFDQALDGAENVRDRDAWNRLLAALAAEDRLSAQLGRPARRLDRHRLLVLLEDLCRWEHLPGGTPEAGRIRVLSAPSVRGLSIPYLFIAGLAESSFPQHRSPQFHAAGEIESLRTAGLRFDASHDQSEDEMLLFYEVLTRATWRLYLSYPALDESAQRLLPSPYLIEVERACGPGSVVRHEPSPLESTIPAGTPLSPQEMRVKGVADALAGSPQLLAAALQVDDPLTRHLRAAWQTHIARSDRDVFGTWEGLIQGTAAVEQLAGRFGSEHCWSASDLEQYAYCPFRFLLERVLHVAPLADLQLDIDAANRGRLMHEALARVYRRLGAAPVDPAVADPDRFRQEFQQVVDELLRQADDPSPLAPAWQSIDRRVLQRWCENYLRQAIDYADQHADLDQPPRPAYFEVSFGIAGEATAPPSTAAPWRLEHQGEQLLLRGRIDRVDLATHDGRTLLNIVDYKSGAGKKSGKQLDPTALQADLYAAAAAELLFADQGATTYGSGYWYLRKLGYSAAFANRTPAESEAYQARREELARTVFALAAGSRRGEFPIYSRDEECTGHCALHTVCRVNQIRVLEKSWQFPPAAGR